jgi:hypothetical protein
MPLEDKEGPGKLLSPPSPLALTDDDSFLLLPGVLGRMDRKDSQVAVVVVVAMELGSKMVGVEVTGKSLPLLLSCLLWRSSQVP